MGYKTESRRDNLDIFISTSDWYLDYLPEFAERFNRYWGDRLVFILCYKYPEGLPANFRSISLGTQRGSDWTTSLREFFCEYRGDRFCFGLEDYYLTENVDLGRLELADGLMSIGSVMKFDLTDDRTKFPHKDLGGYILSSQTARYRSSLQMALWKTEYFLRLLVPERTIWQFELMGEVECVNDGFDILGTRDGIVKYKNACLKGENKC
jgi:hypothetical protein